MRLVFKEERATRFVSLSQKIRVLTENWVEENSYCPNCGESGLNKYNNNKPVADFYCVGCKEDYELKSKQGAIGGRIVDGAYRTMMERLRSITNPNFLFINYELDSYSVINFFAIPKFFFVPDIIEKRKPLALTARRAGWVGCNVLLNHIPEAGKIHIIKDRAVESKKKVLKDWQKTLFLKQEHDAQKRGWLLDVMYCIEKIDNSEFDLSEVYKFEKVLGRKHSQNKHIKDKIRQQLQLLRDSGYLKFLGQGKYRLS